MCDTSIRCSCRWAEQKNLRTSKSLESGSTSSQVPAAHRNFQPRHSQRTNSRLSQSVFTLQLAVHFNRSEERRVGKSVDLGGRRIIKKKKVEQQQLNVRTRKRKNIYEII